MNPPSPNPNLHLVSDPDLAPEHLDPALESALDQVLAPATVPGGIPADLEARILARTLPMLARKRTVVAVLGQLPWMGRIAAMLYFAGLLGLGFTGASIVHDAGTQVTIRRELPVAVANLTQAAEHVPLRVADIREAASPMDRSILLSDLQTFEESLTQELSQLEQSNAPPAMNL